MEYEILEAAFAKAGAELDEKRKSLAEASQRADALERQATLDRQEREELRAQLLLHETLANRREASEREDKARERNAAAVLAEKDASLRCARDELRLERDILAAVRQQVVAAEAERSASGAQMTAMRQRLVDAGLLPADRAEAVAAEPAGSWEAVLEERVRTLEEGLAARDEELAGLRTALDEARTDARRLTAEAPAALARAEAAEVRARLEVELEAAKGLLASKLAESTAGLAAADLARSRLAEQAQWIARRDAQLQSARRETEAVREENEELRAALKARSGGGGGGGGDEAAMEADEDEDGQTADEDGQTADDEGFDGATEGAVSSAAGGGAGGASGLLAGAQLEGRVKALEEQLAAVRAKAAEAAEASSARLEAEAASAELAQGEVQAAKAALASSEQSAREYLKGMHAAEARAAASGGESRVRAIEVSRLSAELGALRAQLQATSQEARAADQLRDGMAQERALSAAELERLRSQSGLRDDLNEQLKAALATESERVARAWEHRERLQGWLHARDDALTEAHAELTAAREGQLATASEVAELREQRRLSEILLRGAEERAALRQAAVDVAKAEAAKWEGQVIELKARLSSMSEIELGEKRRAVQSGEAALEAEQHATSQVRERVELVRSELDRRTAEVEGLHKQLAVRTEEVHSLKAEVARVEVERNEARGAVQAAGLQREAASEAHARLARRLKERGEEVVARGEQLRIAQEASSLLSLESALKDERLRSVEEALSIERTRHSREVATLKQLRSEAESAHATSLDLSRQMAAERERADTIGLRLAQRDEQLRNFVNELRAAEARGASKEARISLLRTKGSSLSQERAAFDARLDALTKRISTYEEEVAAARGQARLLLAEVVAAQATAENHRSEAASLRTSLFEVEGRLSAKEEQLVAMGGRLSTARDDLNAQIAMIEEEMKRTQLQVEAKDLALDLQMEEAIVREDEAHGFMAEVGGRLQRAHSTMVAKDELLSTLEAQLKASVGRLASSESKAEELAREVSIERRQAETATNKLLAIEERHTMMAADLEAATEALDSYRETLVSAEVRMAADREKVAALQTELRQLHTHLASREDTTAPTGQAHPTLGVQGPGRQGAAMLPPLSAATIDVGSSRVHYLYFLASLLLLKSALSKQGQLANVGAQDVFEEIVRNEVPLEEWPTYIFTRVFAQPSTSDVEIAALKAVAHRSAARHAVHQDST